MPPYLVNNNSETYPKVIAPNLYNTYKDLTFAINEIYPNYNKPVLPHKYPPKEVDISVIIFSALLFGTIAFFFVLVISSIIFRIFFMWLFSFQGGDTIFYYFLVLSLIAGLIVVLVVVNLWIKTNNKKVKDAVLYNEKNYQEYLKENQEYQLVLQKISSPSFLLAERRKRFSAKLPIVKADNFKNAQILPDDAIKKGPSEEFFYKISTKYSDFQVYKSLKFGYYYPDLVLIKDNLFFDIEIDEPYTLDKKEPIHFENTDAERDRYFSNNNFTVIHFSEEQILENPLLCIDIINEIFLAIISLSDKQKSDKMIAFEHPIWSYEDAFNLAYSNSRGNLSNKISKLENEYL